MNLLDIGFRSYGPTQLLAVAPGPSEARSDPLSNDVPFQLGNRADDGEDRTAQGAAGVDVFLVTDKVDAQVAEFLQRQDQVSGGSSKPIEAPHQDHLKAALSGIVHEGVQSWP